MSSSYTPNKFAYYAYELALFVFITVCFLGVLHNFLNSHANISRTIDSSHVSFALPKGTSLLEGDVFPVYRFQAEWKTKLGDLKIEEISGKEVTASFDPEKFKWPMGRHGTITAVDQQQITMNIGSSLGLKAGDQLIIFDEREQVGKVVIRSIEPESSIGEVIEKGRNIYPGMVVSEYTVATQVFLEQLSFNNKVDLFICAIALGIFLFFPLKTRKSFLQITGPRIRSGIARIWNKQVSLIVHIALSGFAIRYVLLVTLWYFNHFFAGIIHIHWLSVIFSFLVAKFVYLWPPLLIAFYLLAYIRKTMPFNLLLDLVSFKGWAIRIFPAHVRDIVIWMFHLTIAYAFAHSLFIFVAGNLNSALELAWPSSSVRVNGALSLFSLDSSMLYVKTLGQVIVYMLTHMPSAGSIDDIALASCDILWTITIFGCLIGYSHSIFGYLWGKKIRNLDYTFVGWLLNGWCYGPLFGWLIWQSVPGFLGRDPIFSGGVLTYANCIVGFALNFLYTLTILNMGTMFGVMTDKGVRRTAFYSIARHPSYTLEAMMFVMIEMKGLTGGIQWASAMIFFVLYLCRSEREDHFMSASNPEFLEYKEQVPWKFLPYVY